MRSFINAISSVEFANDRQDRTNTAGMLLLRASILRSLRIYGRGTSAGSAHLPGKTCPGKPKHGGAVQTVESTTTAPGSPAGWRPEQPLWLPAFTCAS